MRRSSSTSDGNHARTWSRFGRPTSNFLIDRLPDAPQVSVAAGFSGHGYKFSSVVGEIMADLAIDGATRHDIGLFGLNRFGP